MFWLLGIIVLGYFWYLWDSNKSKQKKIAYFENEFKKMDIYVNNAKKEAESIVEEAKSTVKQLTYEVIENKKVCDQKQIELEKREADIEYTEKALKAKVKDIPLLVELFADIEWERSGLIEQALVMKRNPSIKGSIEVAKVKREKQKIIRELKSLKYKMFYYEQMVPWLLELEDDDIVPQELEVFNRENTNDEDASSYWLTTNEYMTLPTVERYQRALDRYWNRNKSNWEIGADYERYMGYRFEASGYKVEYRGIIDGIEDRGRDLICRKNNTTVVVQCKCWSSKKQIHENHINQLFGTTLKYYLETNRNANFEQFFKALNERKIVPLLVTSTKLSDVAKQYAKALRIEIREDEKLEKYPMVKCNISRVTKEKIYHLPFDQQYDKVKIDGEGEFYAMTVQEAEDKGFRRAKKWVGNS